ncbi:MAG: hypothetical protein PHE09_16670 [Oscillospiraceae bacterium]|nr:hypothetical protein [Oscillospiraceae bacterium]
MIALIIIPALVGLATAAGVDDWYCRYHNRKQRPAPRGISSKQSVIDVMEERK